MRKIVITLLSLALFLTSLSSCSSIFDHFNIPTDSELETSTNITDSQKQNESDKVAEPPAPIIDYTDKMDIESYLQYFVSYFHEPYQRGDDVSKNNILYLSFLFCFSNKDKLDFVKTDEEKQLMRIPGKELERIAGNLIPLPGNLSSYHLSMADSFDFYSAETDTYIVSYARSYWNGDLYYLDFDENEQKKKPQISETDTELIATVESYYSPELGVRENVRKMEYRFDKVIDRGFLFYSLSSIKEIS